MEMSSPGAILRGNDNFPWVKAMVVRTSFGYFRIARFLGAGIALGIYGLFYIAGAQDSPYLCLGSIVLAIILTLIILAIIHQYTTLPPVRAYAPQTYQQPYYPQGQSMYYQQSPPSFYQQTPSYGAQTYSSYGSQTTKCRYCDSPLSSVSSICPRCGRYN